MLDVYMSQHFYQFLQLLHEYPIFKVFHPEYHVSIEVVLMEGFVFNF